MARALLLCSALLGLADAARITSQSVSAKEDAWPLGSSSNVTTVAKPGTTYLGSVTPYLGTMASWVNPSYYYSTYISKRTFGLPFRYNGQATGKCSIHKEDEVAPPTKDLCSVWLYRCSDSLNENLWDHNVGDVGWALSSQCHQYGQYLHVYPVQIARSLMWKDPSWDSGVLGFCTGGYNMCNRGASGSVCGCGIYGNSCGKDARRNKADANHVGWRQIPDTINRNNRFLPFLGRDLSTCPCFQYSLPKRAMGAPNSWKTEKFMARGDYCNRSMDAPYQWAQMGRTKTVNIERCIKKHILSGKLTLDEKVKLFHKLVVKGSGEPDCAGP